MEKFNCIIIEDEPLAVDLLKDYIQQVPILELKEICNDALYAMEALQKPGIDVMFLDLNLPGLKGLDFVRTLQNPPQIIITTADRDYAVEAYELNVTDYLVKPVNFTRFLMAVNKLKSQSMDKIFFSSLSSTQERPSMFINVSKKRIKVWLDEILYIESKQEYISIVTKGKSYLTKFQIGEIEDHLSKNNFMRVHRSFIVAKEKIDAFTATDVEIAGAQIPIGRSYKEIVVQQLASRYKEIN